LLRGHVGKRPDQFARAREFDLVHGGASEAEVDEARVTRAVDDDVRRLDVTMEHAVAVRVGKGVRQMAQP
jgi:hypothetical protein